MIGVGVNTFINILRITSIGVSKSNTLIENIAYEFNKEGIKTALMPTSQILIEYLEINKNVFDVYKPETEMVAFNVVDLMDILKKMFSGRINIRIDEDNNRLIVEDIEKRSIDVPLLDVSAAELVDYDRLDITDKYVVPADENVIYHVRVLYESLKPTLKLISTKSTSDEAVNIKLDGNVMYINFTKGLANVKDKVVVEPDIEGDVSVSGKYPAFLIKSIFEVLNGDVYMTVTESGVLSIGKVTDNTRVHYIFAPVDE